MSQPTIPFDNSVPNSRLSFLPLIKSLKKTIAQGKPGAQKLYRKIISRFESIPELLQPIEDLSLLEKHSELVETVLCTIFPPASSEGDNIYAVAIPFTFNTIYTSPLFEQSFLKPGTKEINIPEGDIAEQLCSERIYRAYYLILNKYNGYHTHPGTRSVYPFDDSITGLKKYFEVQVDARFVEVTTKDDIDPDIPENAICTRTNRMMEISELWKRLPLDKFIFEGLILIRICDVTSSEVISEIKNTLLNTNAFYDTGVYETLQSHIQTLLGLKEVRTGITPFFKVSGHFVYSELHNSNSLLFRHFTELQKMDEVNECCKQLFYEANTPIVFETLNEKVLKEFDYLHLYLEAGAQSLILCPLKNNGELIGVLEIISEKPGILNHTHITKIEHALPLFTLALEKSADSLDTQIDKVIKEKFTAVQPAVEWKFIEVAWNYIRNSRMTEDVKIERITFGDVYPLYAAIDVRNSSAERSDAIQLDFLEQLNIAGNIISKARKEIQFPLLEEIEFKIRKYILSASDVLLSDEEILIRDFFNGQVVTVFNHLLDTLPSVRKDIEDYFAMLDPYSGVIYHHRKMYEESITKINDVVSKFIDREQQAAQLVYPHYFERYVTDGVEFNMYIGQSIAPRRKFNDMFLQNLKMWQLTTLAKVARLTAELESTLPTLLSTTQLILAQSLPISITFRTAERKFDVDGAYNIRYEIIKKRIDKVHILHSVERLTQPGKIAIVYTQVKEAAEYMEYIEFLQNHKLLKPHVENLELEELQGVVGLKALRVDVELDEPARAESDRFELSSTTSGNIYV
ncbi:MAG TPA: hypothetical protein VI385_03135 [Flavisolibacter sp.]